MLPADSIGLMLSAGIVFAFGIAAGYVACWWLIANRPIVAHRLRLMGAPRLDDDAEDDGPPAVAPELLPDSISPHEVAKVAMIPHLELRRLIGALLTWKPKRHQVEEGFQRSFERHLLDNSYSANEIKRHPQLRWTARDRAPTSGDKRAVPDFVIADSVLVEIKRNVEFSGASDRSLGQMNRYSIGFRRHGPALLVVCNEYDDELRVLVEKTVRSWKTHGAPVMAYFARDPNVRDEDSEFAEQSKSDAVTNHRV
jgi:hypothetical protein